MDTTGIAFFDLLPPAVRSEVTPRLRLRRVAAGRTVFGVGDASADVFFLLSGRAQVMLYSADGASVSVHVLRAPEMFGELGALGGGARSATVTAIDEVSVIRMAQADFVGCLERSPGAALLVARQLAGGVRRLTERVFELSALSVADRVRCELMRLADGGERLGGRIVVSPAPTHAELASRLGTHREAVTRELGALARADIIRRGRRSLEFIDLDRLAAQMPATGA